MEFKMDRARASANKSSAIWSHTKYNNITSRIITVDRNRLSVDNLERLLCTKHWLDHSYVWHEVVSQVRHDLGEPGEITVLVIQLCASYIYAG
jgi:hypothetical protein